MQNYIVLTALGENHPQIIENAQKQSKNVAVISSTAVSLPWGKRFPCP